MPVMPEDETLNHVATQVIAEDLTSLDNPTRRYDNNDAREEQAWYLETQESPGAHKEKPESGKGYLATEQFRSALMNA